MSSEVLFTLAGLVLVIVGGRILYELINAPTINDNHATKPEEAGQEHRPGKGDLL